MNTSTLICERLIECRKALGITKQEAAKRMEMSQPAYLRYESGQRVPSIHVIHYMAHTLGTSADYLTGKTDKKTPNIYWVNDSEDAELFSLVETYNKATPSEKERLMAYYRKLSL